MSTAQSLVDAAIDYAARGWPVFPLHTAVHVKGYPVSCSCGKPGCESIGKHPRIEGGRNSATTDPDQIRAWWVRWPMANVGLVTGAESKLAVVDIDPRHGGDECMTQLIERHGMPPETPKSDTGSGGMHLVFVYVPGFRNSSNDLGPGIDTRGDGGYIVAPPSNHASGGTYTWNFDADLDTPLAPLPDWLNPSKAVIASAMGAALPDVSHVRLPADGSPVAEGGRNNAAASLAGQYFRAGDPLRDVKAKLDEWNGTNPVPLSDDELNTTIASVGRTHARNHGVEIPLEHEAVVVEDDVPPAPVAAPFPAHLLRPPGVIGEICDWINSTAPMPQPELTLGNVLAFWGAVIGRKVRTPSNLRSNIYALGVGESGCGKNHSRDRIKDICQATGLTEKLLGGEEVSSDTAIMSAVFKNKSILFQIDEVGHFISQANSRYAASHQKNIAPTFTKLFSSAGGIMLGKEYAGSDRPRQDIEQPNVCLYGTTVPGRLYEGLTPGEISDGFLGRMLVFRSSNPDPIETDAIPTPVTDSIVAAVSSWFSRDDLPKSPGGNIAALLEHFPATIPFDEEAKALMASFKAECRELKIAARSAGSGTDALWARGPEHAAKVALLLATSVEYHKATITPQIASMAVELVRYLVIDLIASVGSNISGSDYERNLQFVKRLIHDAGPRGLSRSTLSRTVRRFKSSAMEEILKHLSDGGDVARVEQKREGGSGRHPIVFVAARYAKSA